MKQLTCPKCNNKNIEYDYFDYDNWICYWWCKDCGYHFDKMEEEYN